MKGQRRRAIQMKNWGKANLKQPAFPLFMHHNGISHPKIQIKSSNIWQKLQKEA
jgi:hypothetical protein